MTKATQSQLILPLLAAMDDAGGTAAPADVYGAVADSLGLSDADREARVNVGDQRVNGFNRHVRWAMQKAKALELLENPKRGQWKVTGRGRSALREARPGVVVTIFTTDSGIALWGCVESAMRYVEPGSVDLWMTSPPYDLIAKKAYGNLQGNDYLSWCTDVVGLMAEKTASSGSIVMNMGDGWIKGEPCQSLYQERLLIRLVDELGLNLCQRFEWYNPAPNSFPSQWVGVTKVRAKQALQRVWWLSPSKRPKADMNKVREEYSDRQKRLIEQGAADVGQRRPGGAIVNQARCATDNGGRIPHNLIVAANTRSSGAYFDHCRREGLPAHPARFPEELPRFFIKALTDEGDLVADGMAGSGVTAQEAEGLGRRWITIDRVLEYVLGSAGRFEKPQFA